MLVPSLLLASWGLSDPSDLFRLDLLPTFRKIAGFGAVTSYDRTEGNDDGFSGRYSFVRKEGDSLVLADLKGPGCITRIHTPTPTDEIIEFYFDGEAKPRLSMPYRQLFTGGPAPFARPISDYAGGGYYSYVPMPYQKSCKVVLRAPRTQFYDLNFVTYTPGTKVATFDPAHPAGITDAKKLLTSPASAAGAATSHPFDLRLAPGKTVTLFQSTEPGRILSLKLQGADAFAGKDRDILLRVTWDGEKKPSILVPVADFFGFAWGKPAMASAIIGCKDGTAYSYFPMPYRSAKVELVSLRQSGAPLALKGVVAASNQGKRTDEGRFYAVWHRENPTTNGKPFTWLNHKGRGHIVGLSVQAQGLEAGNTFFFEGDDITIADGKMAVHGTGSEDFFNGGWYDVPGRWDSAFNRPLSGSLGYQRYLGRTGGYRLMINDAYPFEKSIVQTFEHGGTGNSHPSDYAGVAYLYSDTTPAIDPQITTPAKRRVVDPDRLVYSAHWTMPIDGFSLSNATLSRGEVPAGKGRERVLSMRATDNGDFDLCFVTLRADIPAKGRYKVYLNAVKGPEAGIVQMFRKEVALGKPVDLYASETSRADNLYVGEFEASEGGNDLMFKLIGKNSASTKLGLDLIDVVCVRQK